MVAIVWQRVCAVFILWTSLREVLNCESRDVQEIAEGLKDVVDWEGLAGWLNVSSGTINTIIENCDTRSNTKAQCCRRELVKTYCDQMGGDPERVKEEIRHVLESKMGIKKQELQLPAIDHESTTTDLPPPQQGQMIMQYVQAKIREFDGRFDALKKSARECLQRLRVSVKRVADALTSLPADFKNEHEQFLKENLKEIYQAPDLDQQFGAINLHWDYLNYQLLDHLIQKFNLEGVKGEMKTYKEDLQQFRKKTPLKVFCRSHKRRHINPPLGFHEVVAEIEWPAAEDVMLEHAEEFRQEYADHYSLRECAMVLVEVLPGSFIITWFIPNSIVEKLKVKVPTSILEKYSVIKMEIAGDCVYSTAMNIVSAVPPASSDVRPVTPATQPRIPSSPTTKKPADTVSSDSSSHTTRPSPRDSSSPTTRPSPREGSSPPPPSQPTHIHEHSVIKKYLINLTTEAIVIGGVLSLIVAMLLHCFCSRKNKARLSPSADSPPSKTRQTRPLSSSKTASTQHDSELRRRKVDEPWRKDALTFPELQMITYNGDKKLRIMQRAQKEWHKIGTELGIEPAVLSSIESVGHGDLNRQCREVFMKWLSKGSKKYKLTWQGLLDLLEAVDLNPLAEEVVIALRSN